MVLRYEIPLFKKVLICINLQLFLVPLYFSKQKSFASTFAT